MMYKVNITNPNKANSILTCLLVLGISFSSMLAFTLFLSAKEIIMADTNKNANN